MSCVGGLGGIGMGLGPGGQPINANRLNSGGSAGSMGPGGQLPVSYLELCRIGSAHTCITSHTVLQMFLRKNQIHLH